ncbi:hypothetical protein AQ611_02020 [Burkholderia singularis]|nr:hypothetical protein AQ611_02020 [Burkholderia sp. Bp7605]
MDAHDAQQARGEPIASLAPSTSIFRYRVVRSFRNIATRDCAFDMRQSCRLRRHGVPMQPNDRLPFSRSGCVG